LSKAAKGIDSLISHIDPRRALILQVHDYPDHDAIASAFALGKLLERREFEYTICYGGTIQSESLYSAVKLLDIPVQPCAELDGDDNAQIIIVDGLLGNKNVRGLPGEVIAVIDHHNPSEQPEIPYWDLRENYGSCCTIIFEYYRNAEEPIEKDAATSLLMGIIMDTAFMTRGVTQVDLDAFCGLFFQGDWETASRLLKNSLSLNDLAVFREAINDCVVSEDFCYVALQNECSDEVMALVADFFVNLREIHFVAVVQPHREEYKLSVRSEDFALPADLIIRKALDGIGVGGGHIHMGGGSIPRDLFPGEQGLRNRFLEAMGKLE
jgi:nanoRNase/pAp phosphatase (c-di-AMP/oligoRNAs hydrolase)